MNNSAGCSRSEQRTDPLLLYLGVFERLLRTQGYALPQPYAEVTHERACSAFSGFASSTRRSVTCYLPIARIRGRWQS
jgi:hypothetical protein